MRQAQRESMYTVVLVKIRCLGGWTLRIIGQVSDRSVYGRSNGRFDQCKMRSTSWCIVCSRINRMRFVGHVCVQAEAASIVQIDREDDPASS